MRALLIALMWIATVAGSVANPMLARIAVISDADSQNLAALITMELSSSPSVSVVERDDLEKVGDELKLRQLAGSDAMGLGKLVGADGLVFLSKAPDAIHARLTSTALGAVLFDLQFKPDFDSIELARLLASQIVFMTPKLKVPPGRLVLISVLNLRAEYGDAEAVRLERQITLALESRLSAIPEFMVLERRHAWAMNFERVENLSPELLHGTYLLDGLLQIPADQARDMTVSLRLRKLGTDQALEIVVKGPADNPSQLAKDISDQVTKAIGLGGPAPVVDTKAEARDYLKEGIWAWRNGLWQSALEALDSAELLGETAPDLLAARIPVLCVLSAGVSAFQPIDQVFLNGTGSMPIDSHPEERIDDVLRAIDDETRYANGGLEQKLEIFGDILVGHTRVPRLEGNTDRLTPQVELAASRVLWMLNQTHHPREEELRQALRSFAGFDPLHHQIPKDWFCPLEYTELWSESPDEVIAYYQLLASTRPGNVMENDLYDKINRILLKDGPASFCARFVQAPSERRALFDTMIDKLIADPATKATGLLVRATWAAPTDKQPAYQAFLDDLSGNRQFLAQSGDLGVYLTSAARLQRALGKPACPEFIDLLHYDLQHLLEWQESPYCRVWQPDLFSSADAPSLWRDFEECKKRTLAYVARHTSADGKRIYIGNPSALKPTFSKLEADYSQQFGSPDMPVPKPAVAPTALTVTQAWHSWQVPGMVQKELKLQQLSGGDGIALGNPAIPFHVITYAVDDGGTLWIYGYHDPYGSRFFGEGTVPATLFRVHLPDLQTEAIAAPWRLTPIEQDDGAGIRFVPDGLYICGLEKHLDHFKISTGEWQRREVNPRISELFPVNGKLYFSIKGPESGLARYDWDTGQTIVLADSRRRPARNQFDDRSEYSVQDVSLLPDGKTCALIQDEYFAIQEQPGTWPLEGTFNLFPGFPAGVKVGVFWSTILGRGFSSAPLFPPFSKEWIRLQSMPGDAMDYGFRDHDIFALVRSSGFKLLWYQPNESTPLPIPLDLKLDDETHALIKSAYKFQFDGAINPVSGNLRMTVSEQGICLFPTINSGITTLPLFWFLPFKEVDAYLDAHAMDKRPAIFNPLSLLPPEVLKNIQAAVQAGHPNDAVNTHTPLNGGGKL